MATVPALPAGPASRSELESAYLTERERAEKLEESKAHQRATLRESAEEGVQSAVIVGTAGACGYADGRYKEKSEVFGMPGAAALAGGALAGLIFKVGGKGWRRYLLSMAQGAAAATATMIGRETGEEDGANGGVSGVGATRTRRRKRRDRDRDPEHDEVPANLPPGLRRLYERHQSHR